MPDKGQYGFRFPTNEGGYYLTNFIWQAGGDVSERQERPLQSCFDTPEGATALRFFAKMTNGPWNQKRQDLPRCGELPRWLDIRNDSPGQTRDVVSGHHRRRDHEFQT